MCLTGTLSAIKLINRPDHTLTYQHLLARQKFHKLCDQQISFLPNKVRLSNDLGGERSPFSEAIPSMRSGLQKFWQRAAQVVTQDVEGRT